MYSEKWKFSSFSNSHKTPKTPPKQNEFQQDRYGYFIFPEGEFTQWTEWSACSLSCGGGVIQRQRRCVNLFVELVDNAAFSCGLEPKQSRVRHFHSFLELSLMEHIGVKNSLDSKLQIYSICFIGTRSRK